MARSGGGKAAGTGDIGGFVVGQQANVAPGTARSLTYD